MSKICTLFFSSFFAIFFCFFLMWFLDHRVKRNGADCWGYRGRTLWCMFNSHLPCRPPYKPCQRVRGGIKNFASNQCVKSSKVTFCGLVPAGGIQKSPPPACMRGGRISRLGWCPCLSKRGGLSTLVLNVSLYSGVSKREVSAIKCGLDLYTEFLGAFFLKLGSVIHKLLVGGLIQHFQFLLRHLGWEPLRPKGV